MALTTLGGLKASIADTLNRTDLTTSIPDWITLAHRDIKTRFSVAEMETSASFTFSVGSPTVALPTNCAELRRVQYTYGPNDIRELKLGPFAPLTIDENLGVSGAPDTFAIVGSNMYVSPTPSTGWSGTFFYYLDVPDFDYADDADTNWLLTDYPNVWLYGSLLSALPKIGNDVRANIWTTYYEAGIDSILTNDKSKRFAKAARMRSAVFS